MIIKYKLTDQNIRTHKNYQWRLGRWERAKGKNNQGLCTDGWLHCYDSSLIAILHNPIHADYYKPRLWEVECAGKTKNDKGIKCGYQKMRLIKEIPVPVITTTQIVAYGILCAMEVSKDKKFLHWAKNWLSGKDRSQRAAEAAEASATATAAAAGSYASAASYAASATATAAAAASYATPYAAAAVYAAVYAVHAKKLNLKKLAQKAMNY